MQEYKVRISEILSRCETVEANSESEAIDLVNAMYNSEEIVLDVSDFHGEVDFNILDEHGNIVLSSGIIKLTFHDMVSKLKSGVTLEQICKDENFIMVEVADNQVYYDDDFYEFMEYLGVTNIEDFTNGIVIFEVDNGKQYYKVPFEDRLNRFDEDLESETVLFFNPEGIFDLTEDYKNSNERIK